MEALEENPFIIFNSTCMCVCAYKCRTHGGQKRVTDPLELELHVVVSCPTAEPSLQLHGRESPYASLEAQAFHTDFLLHASHNTKTSMFVLILAP